MAEKHFVSWNVNGIRACLGKGFYESFSSLDADIFCLQETKVVDGQITLDLPGYNQYWNYAEKKGYSGVAVFSKEEPLNVTYGLGIPEHDTEGRVITLEFGNFYFIGVYVPNAREGLVRIDYRMSWEDAFRAYVSGLDGKKRCCGNLFPERGQCRRGSGSLYHPWHKRNPAAGRCQSVRRRDPFYEK